MANSIHTLILSAALAAPIALTGTTAGAQGLFGAISSIGQATPSTSGQDPVNQNAGQDSRQPGAFGFGGGCSGGVCATPGDANANGVDDITERQIENGQEERVDPNARERSSGGGSLLGGIGGLF